MRITERRAEAVRRDGYPEHIDTIPPPKALVCDDDPGVRRVIAQILTTCGYEVVAEVELAIDAVHLAEVVDLAVAVIDLALVGMSGVEAVPLIRGAAPDCKIIVCTAFEHDAAAVIETGAYEVLDKSDMGRLEAVLRALPDGAARASFS